MLCYINSRLPYTDGHLFVSDGEIPPRIIGGKMGRGKMKRENHIDDSETIAYTSPKTESEDEIDEKMYKEPKLETAVETEKQDVEDEKEFSKSELEQNKVDNQETKEPDIKKVQDVFDKVKEEEPINVDNFFIDDNNIFDSEEVFNADREFIIDLINRTSFIIDTKRFVKEPNEPKMEIAHLEEKNLEQRANVD